ncbi:MAG: thiamine-phosphate kinase [Gemmatimonadetes bacterium]|nr:thiamine-phosphate kinase [Gemmatimonadota bacterium]
MSHSVRLGQGAEFDLIRRVLARDAGLARSRDANGRIRVGPGDDAAVIAAPGIAITSDLSIEDVHFRRAWISPEEMGWRAVMASLSDLAAMAAEPIGILVSLATPAHEADELVTHIMSGASDAAASRDAALLGGDVSRSPGPIVIDVVAAGESTSPVLRSGARAGDALWVTGRLGAAAAAVAAWESGRAPDAAARDAFARPQARNPEALWLAEHGALHALIDLSDGLAGDAGHIAAASGVRILIETDRVPVHPAAAAEAERSGARAAARDPLALALGGGEDYDLCFAAAAGSVEPLVAAFESRFGIPLSRVGEVTEGAGVMATDVTGGLRPLAVRGFSHL